MVHVKRQPSWWAGRADGVLPYGACSVCFVRKQGRVFIVLRIWSYMDP